MSPLSKVSLRVQRLAARLGFALASLYLLLLIPGPDPPAVAPADKRPFAWNQSDFWTSLEAEFKAARSAGCERFAARVDADLSNLHRQLDEIASHSPAPEDPRFDLLETNLFHLAAIVSACPARVAEYIQLFTRLREVVKEKSEHWDMKSPVARRRIYRLLYGGRAAVEEIVLQAPAGLAPALIVGRPEPSKTPSMDVGSVAIHSGDILVSRGGAATSALIARGNDFPGNFSHIALVYVDEQSHRASVIEAHIEKGVAVASIEDYLKEKKLRIMALRLRTDIPQLIADPQLPHKAAVLALREASTRHIPYDFAMDYHDHGKLFCSEVASASYQELGITLWMGISHISSRGITSWLAAFGARHFETQEPSDLEYDPQLRVIGEWRDPETLLDDHIDNAIIDAMLGGAESGEKLDYSWQLLPFARVAKAYSVGLNAMGRVGPIPEGMTAKAALRHKHFVRNHAVLRRKVHATASEFKTKNGYTAPYWELVKLARTAKAGGQR